MSTRTGRFRRSLIARAAVTPTQPGRIAADPTVPESAWIGPGQAHPDAEDEAAVDAGLLEREVDELAGGRQAVLGAVVAGQRAAQLREHGVAEVGDRDGDVGLAEVDADGGAGAAVEGHQDGRAAALRARRGARVDALGDEPLAHEVTDQRGDRGARQTGAPGELGAARDARHAQRAEDAAAVAFAQRLE